jgi:hypothetical protein
MLLCGIFFRRRVLAFPLSTVRPHKKTKKIKQSIKSCKQASKQRNHTSNQIKSNHKFNQCMLTAISHLFFVLLCSPEQRVPTCTVHACTVETYKQQQQQQPTPTPATIQQQHPATIQQQQQHIYISEAKQSKAKQSNHI